MSAAAMPLSWFGGMLRGHVHRPGIRMRTPHPTTAWAFALMMFATGCASPSTSTATPPDSPMTAPRPANVLVIGHRGASALRPEHTLEAYRKAIEDGADLIEPDLVSTHDGVLVARHENEISGTTDVASRPEFAVRRTTRTIDGERVTGWFTEDFTLAELKTLRARERLPDLRSTAWDDRFEIPTLAEILDLAASESAARGRTIGLAPELKHPTHFTSLGLAMETRLLDALRAHPHTRTAPVVIQSFETANLRALREQLPRGSNIMLSNITLLQLYGDPNETPYDTVAAGKPRNYASLATPDALREVATYADAIGPHYLALAPRKGADGTPRSALADAAHAAGLKVIVYTFRPENHFLPRELRSEGSPATRNDTGSIRQIREAIALGIDGFFTDDPALGRRAVDGD
jgi:glycerophosphoryl diester phosphodiesterase